MTQNSPSSEENSAQLQKLALRLLARPFDLQAPPPQLLVGRLPDMLPLDLPLPNGYSIVGSFVDTSQDIQIVLDTDLSPAETIAFYTEKMLAAGWSEPDFQQRQRRSESGFVSAFHRPAFFTTLCKGSHGPALMVSASTEQGAGGKTDTRIHIDTRSRNSPCRQSSEIFMRVGNLIPPLEPPTGGHQQVGGGGSNSESANTSATLEVESDIAFSALADHYAHQLEQAGWQRTGEGSNEPVAWNTWEFRDKENGRWGGVFTLLQMPGMERTYSLHVLINWLEDKS